MTYEQTKEGNNLKHENLEDKRNEIHKKKFAGMKSV